MPGKHTTLHGYQNTRRHLLQSMAGTGIDDGVLFLDGRMFIPQSLRRDVLSGLHAAHQRTSGMKRMVTTRFWWLRMDEDIDPVRAQCRHCNEMATSNSREPLADQKEPEYPWQLVVMDYLDKYWKNFLVVADRYRNQ